MGGQRQRRSALLRLCGPPGLDTRLAGRLRRVWCPIRLRVVSPAPRRRAVPAELAGHVHGRSVVCIGDRRQVRRNSLEGGPADRWPARDARFVFDSNLGQGGREAHPDRFGRGLRHRARPGDRQRDLAGRRTESEQRSELSHHSFVARCRRHRAGSLAEEAVHRVSHRRERRRDRVQEALVDRLRSGRADADKRWRAALHHRRQGHFSQPQGE